MLFAADKGTSEAVHSEFCRALSTTDHRTHIATGGSFKIGIGEPDIEFGWVETRWYGPNVCDVPEPRRRKHGAAAWATWL